MSQPIEGKVVVMLVLDEEGKVGFAEVESTNDLAFGDAALEAAYKWEFEPARDHGQATRYKLRVPFTFLAPSKDEVFANHVDPAVGYDVWIPAPNKIVPVSSLSERPKPKAWKQPLYPDSSMAARETAEVRRRFLVSPNGQVHNPELVDTTHLELFLHAAAHLTTMEFSPAKDETGKNCWTRIQRKVTFTPSEL
jgi:TonB family protein